MWQWEGAQVHRTLVAAVVTAESAAVVAAGVGTVPW